MIEPWFSDLYAWIAGTALGCLAGLWGSLTGALGAQGKAKGLVVGLYWLLLGASAVMLVGGIVGYFLGQPYGVWYALGLGGVIGTVLLSCLGPVMFRAYRLAEERRMHAQDLV